MSDERLFDRIGGEALRAVIADFYGRIFHDPMIGFLFMGKDRRRLIDKEWEFTARLLGADVAYTGRPIRAAHARSPILGGHFERRLQILRDTLADHDVDPEVQAKWIEHTLALRPQVTGDRGSECDHDKQVGPDPDSPTSGPQQGAPPARRSDSPFDTPDSGK